DLVEQALELANIAVNRLLELTVGAVLSADLVERLLSLQSIEPPGKDVALAALVAVPQVGCGIVVDHAGDINRKRIERLDRVTRRAFVAAARGFAGRLA